MSPIYFHDFPCLPLSHTWIDFLNMHPLFEPIVVSDPVPLPSSDLDRELGCGADQGGPAGGEDLGQEMQAYEDQEHSRGRSRRFKHSRSRSPTIQVPLYQDVDGVEDGADEPKVGTEVCSLRTTNKHFHHLTPINPLSVRLSVRSSVCPSVRQNHRLADEPFCCSQRLLPSARAELSSNSYLQH